MSSSKMSGSVGVSSLPVHTFETHKLRKRPRDRHVLENRVSEAKRKRNGEVLVREDELSGNLRDNKQQQVEVKLLQSTQEQTKEPLANVVICSEKNETEGKKYVEEFQFKGRNTTLSVCRGCGVFNDEQLPLHQPREMFLLVDVALIDIMMQGKTLKPSVDNFFEAFAQTGSKVHLINKLKSEHKFLMLLYQLPEGCAKVYREIVVSRPTNEDSSSEEADAEDEQQKYQDIVHSMDHGHMNTKYDANGNLLNRDSDELVPRQAKPPVEGLQTSSRDGSYDCLQVGSHCKMRISAGEKQLIIAQQDGSQNIVNINIVSKSSASKMVVVMTSDPNSRQLEEFLVTELNNKSDIVNISLQSHDTTVVGVRRGSVIMELDVKQGHDMTLEWIAEVLQLILKDVLSPDLLGVLHFDVDIDILNVIPKEQLGEYVMLRDPNKIHQSCVTKSKYDDLQRELKDTKKKLSVRGTESETINIINPKLSSGGSLLFLVTM